ncbi:MAG: hypothetical protein GTO02_03245 [Candidatus Dadabacteria bacterium]|nr:hypothetical protein [Candidatus Dadabacteria bacterium]NIQ13444.1 hypothetical protein [Candidatus Dadabacteria bacterium]
MKFFKYFVLALILISPTNIFAQGGIFSVSNNTDLSGAEYMSAYYDLRNRNTHIQITNISERTITIHVQIFQHDRECDELNFEDSLTSNDTVVYDLDNIIRNDGSEVPINLLDDSYGYIVVSSLTDTFDDPFIGNFRIIDNSGYEYRTNLATPEQILESDLDMIANFNTVDEASFADVVGYAFDTINTFPFSAINFDPGFDFDVFIYDMEEDPLSCDTRNFACGNIMNYGINEDYTASRGENLLCSGGGLADPNGGYIFFDNPRPNRMLLDDEEVLFIGLIGINNGDGTGSMDYWFEIEGIAGGDTI